jgi:Homeodomain-like domain
MRGIERCGARAVGGNRGRPQPAAQAHRAGAIVLASVDRHSPQRIAQAIGVSRPTVWRWQQRFAESGAEGLLRDDPQGRQASGRAEVTARVVALTPAFAETGPKKSAGNVNHLTHHPSLGWYAYWPLVANDRTRRVKMLGMSAEEEMLASFLVLFVGKLTGWNAPTGGKGNVPRVRGAHLAMERQRRQG